MGHYLYLLIDLGCLAIPLLFSFHPRIKFYKEWKFYFPAMLIVAIFFLIWDEWFTQLGVWGFNPEYLLGVSIGHLPLEEILFFICIPYACVFTYFTLKKIFPHISLQPINGFLIQFFFVFSLGMALIFREKLYTTVTFFLLAMSILILYFTKYKKLFIRILISYLLILPFFFISNGLLTGSGIEEQVVWYDDAENLGARIGTIPFEDGFYGFLLILLNILFYEWFRDQKNSRNAKQ